MDVQTKSGRRMGEVRATEGKVEGGGCALCV